MTTSGFLQVIFPGKYRNFVKNFLLLKIKITKFWIHHSMQFDELFHVRLNLHSSTSLMSPIGPIDWGPIFWARSIVSRNFFQHEILSVLSKDSPLTMLLMVKNVLLQLLLFLRKWNFTENCRSTKSPTPSYFGCIYLQNGSSDRAEIFSFFLTLSGLSTVKIWAKSVRSIEQGWSWLTCNAS